MILDNLEKWTLSKGLGSLGNLKRINLNDYKNYILIDNLWLAIKILNDKNVEVIYHPGKYSEFIEFVIKDKKYLYCFNLDNVLLSLKICSDENMKNFIMNQCNFLNKTKIVVWVIEDYSRFFSFKDMKIPFNELLDKFEKFKIFS